jgi:DNA-directed RNA polymerase subunit RPC12/RpoP
MKGVGISDREIVRRLSNKGGHDRMTVCPYCGHKVGIEAKSATKYPACGHFEKMWDADGRWYVRFNQFKQEKSVRS